MVSSDRMKKCLHDGHCWVRDASCTPSISMRPSDQRTGVPLGVKLWPTRLVAPQCGQVRTKVKGVNMVLNFNEAKVGIIFVLSLLSANVLSC